MVIGNAAFHALPHHQAVIRLLRAIRKTAPNDSERLDELLSELRAHHAEFARIGELERVITPWGQLNELDEKQRRAKLDADRSS